jgi:hypothetical protein
MLACGGHDKNKDPWFLLCSLLWMGRRTYYFLLLKVMLNLSLIPLAFSLPIKALYIECNHRLQELLLGELIQGSVLWLVTKKLVIPFFA